MYGINYTELQLKLYEIKGIHVTWNIYIYGISWVWLHINWQPKLLYENKKNRFFYCIREKLITFFVHKRRAHFNFFSQTIEHQPNKSIDLSLKHCHCFGHLWNWSLLLIKFHRCVGRVSCVLRLKPVILQNLCILHALSECYDWFFGLELGWCCNSVFGFFFVQFSLTVHFHLCFLFNWCAAVRRMGGQHLAANAKVCCFIRIGTKISAHAPRPNHRLEH